MYFKAKLWKTCTFWYSQPFIIAK